MLEKHIAYGWILARSKPLWNEISWEFQLSQTPFSFTLNTHLEKKNPEKKGTGFQFAYSVKQVRYHVITQGN